MIPVRENSEVVIIYPDLCFNDEKDPERLEVPTMYKAQQFQELSSGNLPAKQIWPETTSTMIKYQNILEWYTTNILYNLLFCVTS